MLQPYKRVQVLLLLLKLYLLNYLSFKSVTILCRCLPMISAKTFKYAVCNGLW